MPTIMSKALMAALRCAALTVVLLSPWPAASQPDAPAVALPESPQTEFKELFVAVQQAGLFADSKVFPDAVPKSAPGSILELYRRHPADSPAALRRFVDENFSLPFDAAPAAAVLKPLPIAAHIDALWDQLTRSPGPAPPYSSLLALPRPYVVPGGRFRELYYWDSYFTMLGLATSGRHDLVEDMVNDFAALVNEYGHIPNGTRSYYLSRSQPPFFFAMVGLLSANDPADAYAHYLPQLRREYGFWMLGSDAVIAGRAARRVVKLPDGSILNRYWDDSDLPRDESYREDAALAKAGKRDPQQLYRDVRAAAESGWDFSSRWFDDSRHISTIVTTEIIPVDLNSLLWGLEEAIRTGCERARSEACAQDFGRRARARALAIDKYLWDEHSRAYLDYRWTQKRRLESVSAAMLYPLFVGVASKFQAESVAATVRESLLKAGGLVTTTLVTGQQWDAPNGWAPLQWIAVSGLARYGNDPLAALIACRWTVNVGALYRESGKLVEKYDVVTAGRSGGGGEYPLQDGFGWTNGVTRKLMDLYPLAAGYTSPDQCSPQTSK